MPLKNNILWSATITPLASIIGSGFLVSVPLLASKVGLWAVPSVVCLTAISYLIGGSIRYNIQYGEPVFQKAKAGHALKSLESMSHLVLIFAYFISVAYYLVLLSTFGLKLLNVEHAIIGKLIAISIVLVISLVGAFRGLEFVEKLEKYFVSGNLAAIAALLISLLIFGVDLPEQYSWTAANSISHEFNLETLGFLMGLLIIVQGFETTRFMGQSYDAKTRIKAMKFAQISSSLIYFVFFVLMIPLFPYFTSSSDVSAFLEVIGRVTPWLIYVIAAGAIASQFSAAVADSIGASGLVNEISHKHITIRHAYILIGLVAILIIIFTDVTSIVALASRAFALFYALQTSVSVKLAINQGDKKRTIAFSFLVFACSLFALFGLPASA